MRRRLFFDSARLAATATAVALAAAAAGCAGYRLGSSLPPGIRSVHVPTALNQTGEPLIENEITRALISEIQRDGALRAAPLESADAVLTVTLRRHDFSPIAYQRATRSEPDEYRLTLEASFTLTRADGDAILAEASSARGEGVARLAGDFGAAKRAALPEAARDLARDVVRRLVEHW